MGADFDTVNTIALNFVLSDDYSESSFIGILHEKRFWHAQAYADLEKSLYEQGERYADQQSVPRSVAWPVMSIYSYLMQSLGCHLDPNDGFQIENLSDSQIYERQERVKMIFEGFFQGKMPE